MAKYGATQMLRRLLDKEMFKVLKDVSSLKTALPNLEKNLNLRLDAQDKKIASIPQEVFNLLNGKNGDGKVPETSEERKWWNLIHAWGRLPKSVKWVIGLLSLVYAREIMTFISTVVMKATSALWLHLIG